MRPAVRYVPTVDVLRCWRKKHGSTVRVLRIVIKEVAETASDKLLQELDHHLMSKYTAIKSSCIGRILGRPTILGRSYILLLTFFLPDL